MSKTFSNSITIARVADGSSADSIIIETSYDEILKFDTINEANEDVISFSPENFKIRVYNINNEDPILNFNWALYYLNGNQEYDLIAEKTNLKGFDEAISYDPVSNYNTLCINCLQFYEVVENNSNFSYLKSLIKDGNAFFKFIYIVNNKAEAIKYFSIKNGVSSDMAQLNIGANSINMAIRNSSLEFSSDGLSLQNGDFVIFDENEEKIFYTDDLGNLTLKGNVYAEDGYFNGTINAFDGTIGGFNIVSNYYEPIESEAIQSGEIFYILLDEYPITYKRVYTSGNNNYIQLVYENKKYYYRTNIQEEDFVSNKYYTYNGSYTIASSFNSNEIYYLPFTEFKYYNNIGDSSSLTPSLNEEYYAKIDSNDSPIFYKNLGPRLYSSGKEIILDGTNGNIIAENIELGAGARITDQIVFSSDEGNISAALYNPELHDGKILQASNVHLINDGRLFLGTLELYGGTGSGDGYIRSVSIDGNSQYQNGEWRINEDGTAYFNNIYANNAHIQNSILEINTVQSIGSTMIFKDSWTVTNIEKIEAGTSTKYILTLDGIANLNAREYFMTDNNNVFHVSAIQNNNAFSKIEIEDIKDIKVGSIITKLGRGGTLNYIEETLTSPLPGRVYYTEEDGKYTQTSDAVFSEGKTYYYRDYTPSGDCIIAIRGETSIKEAGSSYATGNALTISSFAINNGSNIYTKHLILGELSESGIDDLVDISGYGLYADNVYLNGSLITRDVDNGYCGINTLSDVQFSKNPDLDISPIVFWGGALDKTPDKIQNAPFQVTAQGTMFCTNAIIENSIFTGEIHTAKISGKKEITETEPGLIILDTNKGISFRNTTLEGTEAELFSIGTSGLYLDNSPFINFEDRINTSDGASTTQKTAVFIGELHGATNNQYSTYDGIGIQFGNGAQFVQSVDYANIKDESGNEETKDSIAQLKLKFVINKDDGNESNIEKIEEDSILFSQGETRNYVKTYFDKEVYKGRQENGKYFMEYKPFFNNENQIIGYDVFIQ